MFCNYCGAQLPDGSAFCNFCGAQLSTPQTYGTQIPTQNPVTQPNPYQPPAPEKKSNKSIIIAVIVAIIFVIGAIAAVIVFTGNNDDGEDKTNTSSDSTTSSVSSSAEDENSTKPASTEAPTQKPDTGASSTISRGVINGNTYTNSFAEISLTKPSSWIFATDEQIEERYGTALDGFTDFEKEFVKNSTVYDMLVASPYGSNVSVAFEDLSVLGRQNVTIEKYCEASLNQLTSINSTNYTLINEGTLNLNGNVYNTIEVEGEANGFTFGQKFLIRKKGKYIILICITAMPGADFAEIESMLSSSV